MRRRGSGIGSHSFAVEEPEGKKATITNRLTRGALSNSERWAADCMKTRGTRRTREKHFERFTLTRVMVSRRVVFPSLSPARQYQARPISALIETSAPSSLSTNFLAPGGGRRPIYGARIQRETRGAIALVGRPTPFSPGNRQSEEHWHLDEARGSPLGRSFERAPCACPR